MYNFLLRNGQAVALGIGVLVVIIFFAAALSGLSSAGYTAGTDLVAEYKSEIPNMNFFNFGLRATIVLLIVGSLLALGFGLLRLVTNLKGNVKTLATVVGLFALFFILYSTSSMETTGKMALTHAKFDINEGSSKLISAGLKTTLLLGLGAVGAIFVSEIRNFFK
jgi:hypothetical protein